MQKSAKIGSSVFGEIGLFLAKKCQFVNYFANQTDACQPHRAVVTMVQIMRQYFFFMCL